LGLLPVALAASPCLAEDVGAVHTTDLNGRDISVPTGLSAERTLLLLAFRHSDQEIIQGWKSGLGLSATQDGWLEIPVVGVSNSIVRGMIRSGMRSKHPDPRDAAHVAPLFGDADGFAKAFGVSSATVTVLVIDRKGHVLASASGRFGSANAAVIRSAWLGAH
jgi:hypothetical protein